MRSEYETMCKLVEVLRRGINWDKSESEIREYLVAGAECFKEAALSMRDKNTYQLLIELDGVGYEFWFVRPINF